MKPKFAGWPRVQCDEFLEFVKRCFAQKRKNLLNNLAGLYPRRRMAEALEESGLETNLRAEQLGLEDLARIFQHLRGPVQPPIVSG
jgi:16S rRNA A1518/A1519 N6-dimethyltransferase RsmA/KsgA/DIM1 with predicted DNA glycosylase/AP lyase activity